MRPARSLSTGKENAIGDSEYEQFMQLMNTEVEKCDIIKVQHIEYTKLRLLPCCYCINTINNGLHVQM